MTLAEILIPIAVLIGAIWWAFTGNWGACEECNYNCRQGRNCPLRKTKDKEEI
jgi:hypothetical protein